MLRRHPKKFFDTGHLKADLRNRSVRGSMATVTAQGGKFLLHLTSTVVLARLLTPADFGLVAMVTLVTRLISLFKDLGLSHATIQRDEVTHDQVSTLFWINAGFGLCAAAVAAAFSPLVAWFFGERRLILIMVVLSGGFVLGGLAVQHQALLRRSMQFVALGAAELCGMFLGVAVAVVSACLGAGYWSLVLFQISVTAGTALCLWVACPWVPGWPVRGCGVRPMLFFGCNIVGSRMANYLSRNLDNILIGRCWGAAELGLYTRAYSLLTVPLDNARAPISSVAVPALSRLQDDPERYRRAFLRMAEKVFMLALPLATTIFVGADWITQIVLGAQWSGSGPIFAWLGLALVPQMASIVIGWLLVSQGRSRDILVWGVVGAAISSLSFIIGLPWKGLGVARAYAIGNLLICSPFLFWWACRKGPVKLRDILILAWPFGAVSLVVWLAGFMVRLVVSGDRACVGLICLAAVCFVVTAGLYAVVPPCRRAVRDACFLIMHVRRAENRQARSTDVSD